MWQAKCVMCGNNIGSGSVVAPYLCTDCREEVKEIGIHMSHLEV